MYLSTLNLISVTSDTSSDKYPLCGSDWQWGHLILKRCKMFKRFKIPFPPIPKSWKAAYTWNTIQKAWIFPFALHLITVRSYIRFSKSLQLREWVGAYIKFCRGVKSFNTSKSRFLQCHGLKNQHIHRMASQKIIKWPIYTVAANCKKLHQFQ